MTFALKDYNELKEKFNTEVAILLRREKVASIDELPADKKTRKEELLFLTSVINELDARIADSKPRNLKPFAEIFAGALLVVKQDIKDTTNWPKKPEGSNLFKFINEVFSVVDEKDKKTLHVPSIHQNVSYYSALNNFLPLIFKDKDSRGGLSYPNALDTLDTDRLATFVTSSYQLELDARKELTKNFAAEGKEMQVNGYKVAKDTPATALAQFTTFAQLKADLKSLILDECADKNVNNVNSLTNKDRVAQIRALETVATVLSDVKAKTIKENDKIAILAGMMLITREQIGHEYSKKPFNTDDIGPGMIQNGSVLHTGLTKILKAKEMGREDAQALITAAQNFTTFMTLERTEVKGVVKDQVRNKNIFSDVAGFNLPSVFDFVDQLIKCCRIDSLQRCVTSYKAGLEALKPKEPTTSYSSYLNVAGWLGKGTPKTDNNDKDTSAQNTNTTSII